MTQRYCPHTAGRLGNWRALMVVGHFRCPRCDGTGDGDPYVETADGEKVPVLMSKEQVEAWAKTVRLVRLGP